jgi:hypothetical protein
VRIFKNKSFTRFARKARLPDSDLREAVAAVERGLIDATLGEAWSSSGLRGQGAANRAAFARSSCSRQGRGRSSSTAFAKSEQDNIPDDELPAFKMLAAEMLGYDEAALARAIANGTLTEVNDDD